MIELRQDETPPPATIDMAPLIDMTFLLLIFFLLNTHFIKDTGVNVALPNAMTGVSKKTDTIRIAITASGTVHMDNRQVDVGSISRRVARMKLAGAGPAAIIIADKNARTGLLVRVVDQVRLAGIKDVSIATRREDRP